MPYVHEFGIIAEIEAEEFENGKDRPYNDLCYYGITLIPPSSHAYFLKIVSEANDKYKSEELEQLMVKIEEALNYPHLAVL